MIDASLIVRCDCHSLEHLLVFDAQHWDNEKPQNSDISVHLGIDECLPWWKRVALAARYALTGKTTRYWWAETIIADADAVKLRDFLSEYLAASLNRSS